MYNKNPVDQDTFMCCVVSQTSSHLDFAKLQLRFSGLIPKKSDIGHTVASL